MQRGLLVSLVLSITAIGFGAARAQATDADLGEVAQFLPLFPELRRLPAPNWLVPGVRVSYQAGAAAIGSDVPASGAGIVQYDVVETDGVRVLAFTHSYIDSGGAGLILKATGSAIGMPGAGSFWINPAVLQNAEAVSNANLRVTRLPHPVGGQNLSVVRFQGGQSVTEFEVSTGLLVFSSAAAGTSLAQMTLVGRRTLTLPWGRGRAPNWVRPSAAIQFSGTQATTVPPAGTATYPLSLAVQITQAGARWSQSTSQVTLAGTHQTPSSWTSGEGQLLGALWLPRSALTAQISTARTLVDTDPATGAKTFIWRDTKINVLQSMAPAGTGVLPQETLWAYDPTLGVLDGLAQRTPSPPATFVTNLARTGGNDLSALAQQPELPEDPLPTDNAGNQHGGCTTVPGSSLLSVFSSAALLAHLRRSKRS